MPTRKDVNEWGRAATAALAQTKQAWASEGRHFGTHFDEGEEHRAWDAVERLLGIPLRLDTDSHFTVVIGGEVVRIVMGHLSYWCRVYHLADSMFCDLDRRYILVEDGIARYKTVVEV